MALVLVRDLNGKGNFDTTTNAMRPLVESTGRGNRKRWVRTGGDALVLETAKARNPDGSNMVFRHWEPVRCMSARQERQILEHVQSHWGENAPVVYLDMTARTNPDVFIEFLERHPDEAPSADPSSEPRAYAAQMAQLIAKWQSPATAETTLKPSGVKFDDLASMSTEDVQAMINARSPTNITPQPVRTEESPADAIYNDTYQKHREAGKTEGQAANYANKKREAALRREQKGA
jgi:hypothetical protein